MNTLRLPLVLQKIGMSRAWLYREVAAGRFPEPLALGSRARGWVESDVDAWLKARQRGVSQTPMPQAAAAAQAAA
jgi:prophage regulatory protein